MSPLSAYDTADSEKICLPNLEGLIDGNGDQMTITSNTHSVARNQSRGLVILKERYLHDSQKTDEVPIWQPYELIIEHVLRNKRDMPNIHFLDNIRRLRVDQIKAKRRHFE